MVARLRLHASLPNWQASCGCMTIGRDMIVIASSGRGRGRRWEELLNGQVEIFPCGFLRILSITVTGRHGRTTLEASK